MYEPKVEENGRAVAFTVASTESLRRIAGGMGNFIAEFTLVDEERIGRAIAARLVHERA